MVLSQIVIIFHFFLSLLVLTTLQVRYGIVMINGVEEPYKEVIMCKLWCFRNLNMNLVICLQVTN